MVWLNGEPRPLEGKTLKEVLEEMGVELKGVIHRTCMEPTLNS